MSVQIARKHFTMDEFYRMAAAGILREDERVEPIAGEIVEMRLIGSQHAACVKRLITLMTRHPLGGVQLSVQDPIRLNDVSEPHPDVALLKFRDDFYAGAHPSSGDVLLLIEVADTSLEYDREVKVPLYAAAGIPEVWLIDLPREVVEVYIRPSGGKYRSVQERRRGAVLSPQCDSELVLPVADILGQ